eukprot:s375_g5.t2
MSGQTTGPRRSSRVRGLAFCFVRSPLLLFQIIFMMVMRVGEAAHPGPNPRIGVANPCCALHKAHLFQDVTDPHAPTAWGLSETHLTQDGVNRFRRELQMLDRKWQFVPGAPAQPLTTSPGCVGGKAMGVGVLSTCPARALTNQWEPHIWESARLQACAIRIQQRWVKMGIAYGYAKQCHTRATREATDQILEQLTGRIVFQSKGFRIIGGDLNQDDPDALEQFAIWRRHGFVEIQDLAAQKWGQEIRPTCHHKTRKDQMWISGELIPYLMRVEVDHTVFPDHATLVAEFSAFDSQPSIPCWRKPMPLPWDDLTPALLARPPSDDLSSLDMVGVFQQLEKEVDQHLRAHQQQGLLPQQNGRAKTVKLSRCRHDICPIKPARKHEVQITYLGEHFVHTKWCRQLRRLQSLDKLMQTGRNDVAANTHKTQLWNSIKAAPGFPGGFANTWKQRGHNSHGSPLHLPKQVPDAATVAAIFKDFHGEFQCLEKALIKARCSKAREARVQNLNAIYRDVAKPRSLPVSTVVVNTNAEVTEVSVDGLTLTYQPANLCVESPVNAELGPLKIASHDPGRIVLQEPQGVEPGESIHQPKMLGDLPQIFQAFTALWTPMWCKHQNSSVQQWAPIMQQIEQHVPVPTTPLLMETITTAQWLQAVQKKKSTSAVGPDGISKQDLQRMPTHLVEQLVRCINDLEQSAAPWPQACMVGLISAIEKHSAAASPSEYRPITVLSMVYRTYASIRTKQLLRWIHSFADPGLKGNMPNQSTTQVWRMLAEQIEHAHYGEYEWSGIVTDICKCFNTLPRHVVYFCGRHLGIPAFFMRAWLTNVSQIERRFVVAGSCSPAIVACTGFPEGDPLKRSLHGPPQPLYALHSQPVCEPGHHTELR